MRSLLCAAEVIRRLQLFDLRESAQARENDLIGARLPRDCFPGHIFTWRGTMPIGFKLTEACENYVEILRIITEAERVLPRSL